jgi:hypothetical protein
VGRERAQTGGSDRLYEGARVRLDGVDGFRVVRDRCLFFLSPLLRALGLLHRDASMPPPQVGKFLQLNRMIRMLRPLLLELIARGEPRRLVDAGCGLSYLTLSLAWC